MTELPTQAEGPAPEAVPVAAAPPPADSGRGRVLGLIERFALPALLLLVIVFFSVWSKTGPTFRMTRNFQQIAASQAFVGILAIALIIPLSLIHI